MRPSSTFLSPIASNKFGAIRGKAKTNYVTDLKTRRLFSAGQKSYRLMSQAEKISALSTLIKKLRSNQEAFLVEKIDQVQEEILKENLEDQIKSKKGVLHELLLDT